MKLLGIDTTSNVATVAVVEEHICLGEIIINSSKTHSQKIMPIIDDLLRELELEVKDLDGIVVSSGPGSFTGVRIGMATAKAIGHGAGLPVYTVSALEAMSNNATFFDGIICPIMDARRDQVYTAMFRNDSGKLVRVLEDSPLSIDELLDLLNTKNEKVLFLGDGIQRFEAIIYDKLNSKAIFAPINNRLQRASSVCLTINSEDMLKSDASYSLAKANYLRKSQAEREYDEKRS